MAFLVRKTGPVQTTAGTITFEHLALNYAGIWNTVTNHYIIPYKGVYVITLSLITGISYYFNGAIDNNGNAIQGIYARPDINQSATASIIVELEGLDQISCSFSTGAVFGDGRGLTHFSGFLLFVL